LLFIIIGDRTWLGRRIRFAMVKYDIRKGGVICGGGVQGGNTSALWKGNETDA